MLNDLSKKIEYEFKDASLLQEALTHPSTIGNKNYERLEFLGDAILSFIITTILIEKFKEESEGDLAKRRASVINGEVLGDIANKMEINHLLIISASEESSGGRYNKRNLENTVEAIIGAMYLDGGIEVCKNFIVKYWSDFINANISPPIDDKTYLQEWSQEKGHGLPEYQVLDKLGPAHKPSFLVEVRVGDLPKSQASASSKKEAEKKAAQNMIEYIKSNEQKI